MTKLKLRTLSDLNGLSAGDFAKTGADGADLVRQLEEIIVLAQQVGERISVPTAAQSARLADLKLPVRLARVLKENGFKSLGDLDGVPVLDFYGFPNCGAETVKELEKFLQQVSKGTAAATVSAPIAPAGYSSNEDIVVVSPNARDLIPADLPISVRLEGVIGALGARKLGDLTGRSFRDIVAMKNCGRKTVAELRRLLERAAAGEFVASPLELARMTWADLPAQIDGLIAQLPKRTRQILELRFTPPIGKSPTLEVVGRKYNLTRERVRQVLVIVAEGLLRSGGVRLKAQAQRIAGICEQTVCPFTPQLLERWVAAKRWNFQYEPVFYVRLMGLVYPSLPAWPDGQEPFFKPAVRSDKLGRLVEAVLGSGVPSLPLRSALDRARQQSGNKKILPFEFLLELKHSWNLEVLLPQPDRPEVILRRGE